jgi:hypothetical protein
MKEFGKNACIKYERGEKHSIETADENLVFVALLKGSPRNTNG